MKVLVINCGSSSLKYQLIDMKDESVLAKGLCERIGIDGRLTHSPAGKDKVVIEKAMPDHTVAVQMVLDALVDAKIGVIASTDEISAVGHRVVHGGKYYCTSVIVTDEVKKTIGECVDLAPLHVPANIIGIEACEKAMPGTPQVAVFDTAFHQTMPAKAYLYAIPKKYYDEYHIRRYGFHGTSHSFVSKKFAKYANLDLNNSKIIVCHLGNGASCSAVLNGQCIDTSMGMTPIEGLIMGTRCGDLDVAVVEYISNKEHLSIAETMDILNKKSGVLGMSGVSSDFRDLENAANDGNVDAKNAQDAFAYRAAKYIGAYAASLNGVDGIAFTAGIGENDSTIRRMICSYLGYLGVEIDPIENAKRGVDAMISTTNSKVKVAIIPTNEELAIAVETVELVQK